MTVEACAIEVCLAKRAALTVGDLYSFCGGAKSGSFSQGLDIRLVTLEMAELLAQVRLWKRIHFAWDDIAIGREVREGIKVLEQGGVSLHDVTFYVLIGFDSTPEQDLHRVETLRALRVNPFVMPYDKAESYQRRFARWCNNKAVFESCMWPDYKG